uniref:Potassium channel domain-containing protein n=1 Tax=Panagrolaimus superbus TaxID=310955 RepID=A0A914YM41_9BILA
MITTLGYGILDPMTINGRVFAVIFGCLGIPITVIMFSNFGRYLQSLEVALTRLCCRRKSRQRIKDEDIQDGESMAGGLTEIDAEVSIDGSEESSIDLLDDMEQISAPLLIGTVILYMVSKLCFSVIMTCIKIIK